MEKKCVSQTDIDKEIDVVVGDAKQQQQQQFHRHTSTQSSTSHNFVFIVSLCVVFVASGAWYHVTVRLDSLDQRLTRLDVQCRSQVLQPPGVENHLTPPLTTAAVNNTAPLAGNRTNTTVDLTAHVPIDNNEEDTFSGAGSADYEILPEFDLDVTANEYYASSWGETRRRRRSVGNYEDDEDVPLNDDASVFGTREPHGPGRQQHNQQVAATSRPNKQQRSRQSHQQQDGGAVVPTTVDPLVRNTRRQRNRTNGDRREQHRGTKLAAAVTDTNSSVDRSAQPDQVRMNTVAMKAAHFHAPPGPDKQYISDSLPPATFSFWRADNWAANQSFYYLNTNRGIVTVLESGLYMIYAQLVYHDQSGRWSFGIFVNDKERLKCLNTEHVHQPDTVVTERAPASHGVYQHCYTSAVQRLDRLDQLSIRCMYGSRTVLMQPEFTFWGLVKLAD